MLPETLNSAGAAAAADRLGDEARRVVTEVDCGGRTAGRDIAVESRVDGPAIAAVTAVAADSDRSGYRNAIARRCGDADAETALAAAAADRLRDEASRIIALGDDVAARIDIDRPANAAARAGAAETQREGTAEAFPGRQRRRNRGTPGAAAAADALREKAFGEIAGGENGDVAVDIDGAAVAAAAAIAANGDAGRAESAGGSLDREAARSAAAADRLRDKCRASGRRWSK